MLEYASNFYEAMSVCIAFENWCHLVTWRYAHKLVHIVDKSTARNEDRYQWVVPGTIPAKPRKKSFHTPIVLGFRLLASRNFSLPCLREKLWIIAHVPLFYGHDQWYWVNLTYTL